MVTNYPERLPIDCKPVWFYSDCFPASAALKLTSIFLHENYNMNMHAHDFFEVNLVIKGEGVHYSDGKRKLVSRGDIVIIPPNCYHGYWQPGGLDVFHVLLHKNFFLKYAGDLNTLSAFRILFNDNGETPHAAMFRIDNQAYERIDSLCWQACEFEKNTYLPSERSDNLLSYSLIFALIVMLCKEYTRQNAGNDSSGDAGVIAASEFIHKNYAQKIVLDDLCKISMMSKTLLCEKFKRYYGFTPLDYVNRYRVLVAKNMVIETNKSITEIAQETGFFDASHFLKTYKKYESLSPTDLRDHALSSMT